MNRENLFEECYSVKHGNIKVKTLQRYASKCDKITYGCDEMKLISKNDLLSTCPCFQKVQNNYTNSKDVLLDLEQFRDCVFDAISISLDVFDSFLLYKVYVNYEGKPYNLFDFKFYFSNSKTAKQNKYMSDILIHGKAWRIQVVSGGKFNIGEFIVDLLSYDTENNGKYMKAFSEYYITRFDFRIDFFHDNKVPHLKYTDIFSSTARSSFASLIVDKHSKQLYTGWTCGDRKNKYIYTRMYQKQIEALDKGHGELYIDYLQYPGKVWRLEFEFLSKFTTARYPSGSGCGFFQEFNNHELTKQVFEYIGLSERSGYFSKPKNKIEVPYEQMGTYEKKKLITTTKNNIIRLQKGGINPYVVVNYALKEYNDAIDRQVIEEMFASSIWGDETLDTIIKRLEATQTTTKDLYEKFLKNQIGVDI